MDVGLALEALSAICNAKVTSVQRLRAEAESQRRKEARGLSVLQLFNLFSPDEPSSDEPSPDEPSSDESSSDEPSSEVHQPFIFPVEPSQPLMGFLQSARISWRQRALIINVDADASGQLYIIDEDEFFDPKYDCDFTNLKDSKTFYRGGEKYERPCGWYRFGLKVRNKYGENTWLGNSRRGTVSMEGEWPVSYHGTSKRGAEGIIEEHYKPGPRQRFGRGVYSTPHIDEAIFYSSTFTSRNTGKMYRVILQNRINPEYREIHRDSKYWLARIEKGTSEEEEAKMVERAIRPYGLLLKEV